MAWTTTARGWMFTTEGGDDGSGTIRQGHSIDRKEFYSREAIESVGLDFTAGPDVQPFPNDTMTAGAYARQRIQPRILKRGRIVE